MTSSWQRRTTGHATWVIMLTLLILLLPASLRAELWGSDRSTTYHIASCRYAKKIGREHRINFASAKEARAAGYKACEVCIPPGAPPSAKPPGAPRGGDDAAAGGRTAR